MKNKLYSFLLSVRFWYLVIGPLVTVLPTIISRGELLSVRRSWWPVPRALVSGISGILVFWYFGVALQDSSLKYFVFDVLFLWVLALAAC